MESKKERIGFCVSGGSNSETILSSFTRIRQMYMKGCLFYTAEFAGGSNVFKVGKVTQKMSIGPAI